MDKPKRQYTVSPKVLAANGANLLRANAVPQAIRYRRTARRLGACRANLLTAQAALKAPGDGSPAYGASGAAGRLRWEQEQKIEMLKMKNEATDFVENKPDSKRPGKNEPKKSSQAEEEARGRAGAGRVDFRLRINSRKSHRWLFRGDTSLADRLAS